MGDCLKSPDKMGLPDDLLLNWCRDGYFGPTQGKGEEGEGRRGRRREVYSLENKQHRGGMGCTWRPTAERAVRSSPTPPCFGTQVF